MTDPLISRLRATIEDWKRRAAQHVKHGDCYRKGEGWGLEVCANELEALLAAHEAEHHESRSPDGDGQRREHEHTKDSAIRADAVARTAQPKNVAGSEPADSHSLTAYEAATPAPFGGYNTAQYAAEAATPWRVEVEAEEGCFAVDVWRGDEAFRLNVFDELREADSYRQIVTETFSHSKLAHEAATPAAEWTALDGSLTIRFLQYINAKRAVRWHQNGGIKSWSALEWAGAMAGEAGEACNAAKKLKRIEDKIANINLEEGRSLTDEQNASSQVVDEIADTVIYGVLLAERVGLDLEEAIRMKFNRKSEEYGFPERIQPNQPPASAEAAPVERPDMVDAAEMLWVVLANVSGGDWTKQTPEWQEAAARWRDNYLAALPALPPSTERTL